MSLKLLYLDIESLPHHAAVWSLWGVNVSTNQILKAGRTTCVAWKWQGSKRVEFASEWGEEDYRSFLLKIHKLLDDADVLVTYNGIKFDIPTLYKEFVQHKIPPPSPFHHVDLYRTVRRQFRFASSKLDYVCQQLGLGAKVSHRGMDLWHDVEAGCPKAQAHMARYNRQDVSLLEKLYNHIKPWIRNHPSIALLEEKQGVVCPTCGSDDIEFRGWRYTKTRRYRRMVCNSCHSWSSVTASDKEVVGETSGCS